MKALVDALCCCVFEIRRGRAMADKVFFPGCKGLLRVPVPSSGAPAWCRGLTLKAPFRFGSWAFLLKLPHPFCLSLHLISTSAAGGSSAAWSPGTPGCRLAQALLPAPSLGEDGCSDALPATHVPPLHTLHPGAAAWLPHAFPAAGCRRGSATLGRPAPTPPPPKLDR